MERTNHQQGACPRLAAEREYRRRAFLTQKLPTKMRWLGIPEIEENEMKKLGIIPFASVLLFSATPSFAQKFDYKSIDVPCSAAPPTSCPDGIAPQTVANGINADGDIVGFFTDGVGKQHGFLLKGGQFTTVDVPGAIVGVVGTLPTTANGISPAGEIVGNYTAPYIPQISDKAQKDSARYCPAAGS